MFTEALEWASGGSRFAYHTLVQCLGGDVDLAIALSITGLLTFVAYCWIAASVFRASRDGFLAVVFLLCGFTSYGWIFLSFFAAVYRAKLILMVGVCALAWICALRAAHRANSPLRNPPDQEPKR